MERILVTFATGMHLSLIYYGSRTSERMKKILKTAASLLIVLLLVLILSPLLFKDRIKEKAKIAVNQRFTSESNFSDMSLSFFRHFPRLTLTLHDFSLKASAPFNNDTLICAERISFGVDVKSLFRRTIRITHVYVGGATVLILYNRLGDANFRVYKPFTTPARPGTASFKSIPSTSGTELDIRHMAFRNCNITYADPTIPIKIVANGLRYSGTSRMAGNMLDLISKVTIESVDLVYHNMMYLDAKPLKARFRTIVNTGDLSVQMVRNEFRISDIPLDFAGMVRVDDRGYQFGLDLLSEMGKEFFRARLNFTQADTLFVYAEAEASMDLERWSAAFGLKDMEVKGWYELSLRAEGPFVTGPDTNSLRNDTVVLCVPRFNFTMAFSQGYMKYHSRPHALDNLHFALNASCSDHDINHMFLYLNDLNATFLRNQVNGFMKMTGLKNPVMDADIIALCDLVDLEQVLPVDSLSLGGRLDAYIRMKGTYSREGECFPVTTAVIDLKNGYLKTPYYPGSIENIEFHVRAGDETGLLKDLKIIVNPLSFQFEGKPFQVVASLTDFSDLHYTIRSKGTIDLGKIYRVFAREGTEPDGYVTSDILLQGKQSDAEQGHIDRLRNTGTLTLHNIALTSRLFPRPFFIRTGDFRFDQDKVWFDDFHATYGSSDFHLNGALNNIVNYIMSENEPLKGYFRLYSDFIDVDEFPVFAGENNTAILPVSEPAAVASGVVMIPPDLSIVFSASARSAAIQGLNIRNFRGQMIMTNGFLLLREAGFHLIDSKVSMDAVYGSIDPWNAFFDFHIRANDIDVRRAFNEMALVRELAAAAGKAEGIASLDYSLEGQLDDHMFPVMESLHGGGTLSLKKVKVKNLKLFSEISRKTQKQELGTPELSKVEIRSTVRNSTIHLEPFRFKVSGIDVKISGQSTLDSRLNLRIRLGLPPSGTFGIPLKVTGTTENPWIRFGRAGQGEDMAGEEYTDELPRELIERIRNAREENLPEIP